MTNTTDSCVSGSAGVDATKPAALLALLDDPDFPAADRERWKYTNVKPLRALIHEGLSAAPTDSNETLLSAAMQERLVAMGVSSGEALTFSNGAWQRPKTNSSSLVFHPGTTTKAFDARVPDSDLSKLNSAAPEQYMRIQLGSESLDPVTLIIVYGLSSPAPMHSPQIDIEIAEGRHLEITEYFLDNQDQSDYFCNYTARFSLSTNARLVHTRVNLLGESARIVCDTKIKVARAAHAESLSVDLGAQLARNETSCIMDGSGAHARTAGVALGHNTRQIDHIVAMHHLVGDATSEQDYVAVLADRSSSVFKGKVYVADGADGTDTRQSSRNLLLSDTATVNTMPELEIYADDVKCAHGATTGQLDEAALFYLCSRGIPEPAARDLLIRAFADKTLTALSDLMLREQLSGLIGQTLSSLLPNGVSK